MSKEIINSNLFSDEEKESILANSSLRIVKTAEQVQAEEKRNYILKKREHFQRLAEKPITQKVFAKLLKKSA